MLAMEEPMNLIRDVAEIDVTVVQGDAVVEIAKEAAEELGQDTGWKRGCVEEEEYEDDDDLVAVHGCSALRCLLAVFCIRLPPRRDPCAASRTPAMSDAYSFVPATREQVEAIRRQLGTSEEDIRGCVASLREWLSKQPHLPDHIDDGQIERMYINCKCSMERVKRGLDAYFSLRTRYPEVLMNRDPTAPDIVSAMEHLKIMTMPRLTKDLYRVHVIADIDSDPSWFILTTYAKITTISIEMMLCDDYSLGDVLIIDLKDVHAGHAVRLDINVLRALEYGHKTAFCRRLKALHFTNVHKVIDVVMKFLKLALSEKLQERIHVHLPGSTTLLDHVAKEDLPDELGGTAGPMEKFSYEFVRRAEKKRDWFLEQDRYCSDESRRPRDNLYANDLCGPVGSFKKLAVD